MKTVLLALIILISLNAQSQSLMKAENIDEDAKFFFYGSSSVNTTEELTTSISGSQSFSFGTIIKKINSKKDTSNCGFGWLRGVKIDLAANLLNLRPTGIPKDSIDVVSLMFPETGNSGFMINLSWVFYNQGSNPDNYRIGIEGSMALRQTKVNSTIYDTAGTELGSESINFSALNYTVMPYFSYFYKKDDFEAFISIGIPFGFMNIPNEDVAEFTKLFPYDENMFKDKNKSSIPSVGARFTAGVNNFMFFIDLRDTYQTKNLNDNNPFKGFVYNFGFASKLTIFKK